MPKRSVMIMMIIFLLLMTACDGNMNKEIPSVSVWFAVADEKLIDDRYYDVKTDGRVKYEVNTTIEPERYYWAYIGEKRDTIGSVGATSGAWKAVGDGKGLEDAVSCTPGSWRFYLRAYTRAEDRDNDTRPVYEGKVENISFASEENVISIPVEYNDIKGTGVVEVKAVVALTEEKVTDKEDSAVTKVMAVIGKKSIELNHIEYGEYEGKFDEVSSDEEEIRFEVYLDGEKSPRSVVTADNLPVKTGLTTLVSSNVTSSIYNPSFSITYDLDGGTAGSGETPYYYNKGSDVTVTDVPVKRGYEFGGWNVDGTGYNNTVTVFKTSGRDMAFTAIWDLVEYRLTYDLAGGRMKDGETNPAFYTVESGEIKLKSPEKDGYDFEGWQSPDGSIGAVLYNVTGDLDLKAVWSVVTYPIEYDLGGGHIEGGDANPETYTVSDKTLTIIKPEKDGCYFDGWLLEDGSIVRDDEISAAAGGMKLTAVWKEINFTAGDRGPAGGYIFYDKGSYSDGWRFIECAPADLDKGYVFGWYRPDGTNETVGTTDGLGAGKANTKALVKAMGDTAYVSETGTEKDVYAAKACLDYEEGGYDDWYLPSTAEMAEICSVLKADDIGAWKDYYWTSTEKSETEVYLWYFVHVTEEMLEENDVTIPIEKIPEGVSEAIDRYDYDMYIRPVRYF